MYKRQSLLAATPAAKPHVLIATSLGEIEVELDPAKAPISVKNFLEYVDSGYYDGTLFHRVIPGFMVQTGGFSAGMQEKKTRAPIKNEADNGLLNERGTLAMARTGVVDSATSQFFINLTDNDFLNHGARDFGYAAVSYTHLAEVGGRQHPYLVAQQFQFALQGQQAGDDSVDLR